MLAASCRPRLFSWYFSDYHNHRIGGCFFIAGRPFVDPWVRVGGGDCYHTPDLPQEMAVKIRDRLASDGITANEVAWFRSELTSAERASLAKSSKSNPLLADAYLETLANRLTASRIISRSKREMLRVERQINRARTVRTPDSESLQQELAADHERLKHLQHRQSTI